MDPATLKKLNRLRQSGKKCVLITDLRDGRDRAVGEGDFVAGALGEAIKITLESGKAKQIELSGRPFFLNPFSAL